MFIKKQHESFISSVIDLIESSELKYKSGDFKGSIDDRREVKRLFKKSGEGFDLKHLISKSTLSFSKYNLIEDYKTRIDDIKRLEIIKMLEKISDEKYRSGDYKAAIRAFRRAEKYY
tara:strand:+ start:957 stop:1307 length:351 start_codon:yes stop_codon:yes gene_type:complete